MYQNNRRWKVDPNATTDFSWGEHIFPNVLPSWALTGAALMVAVALHITSLGGVGRCAADRAIVVCMAAAQRGQQSCCSLAYRAVCCRNGRLLWRGTVRCRQAYITPTPCLTAERPRVAKHTHDRVVR